MVKGTDDFNNSILRQLEMESIRNRGMILNQLQAMEQQNMANPFIAGSFGLQRSEWLRKGENSLGLSPTVNSEVVDIPGIERKPSLDSMSPHEYLSMRVKSWLFGVKLPGE